MNGFADLARPSDTEAQAAAAALDEQSVPSGASDEVTSEPDSAQIVSSDEPEKQEEGKTPDTPDAEKAEKQEKDGPAR